MGQDVQRMLQAAEQLAMEIREHATAAEKHSAEAVEKLTGFLDVIQEIRGVEGEIHHLEAYVLIENGKQRPANEAHVEQLRKEWDGDLLLDEPGRVLQVKNGKKTKRLRLGRGGLGYGVEKVLLKGMTRPGVPFGLRSFDDVHGSSTMGSAGSLSRYIWEIRKAIGDSARKSRHLLTVEVDRSLSPTGRGYEFNRMRRYLVIRRTGSSSGAVHP